MSPPSDPPASFPQPDLWPRTGRDSLAAATAAPQPLSDYLFGLEGQIAFFSGAGPDPHAVLAPTTFLSQVTFAGGVVIPSGAGCLISNCVTPPSGTFTVNGNLTVTGSETIDLTETVLGHLTVNVASGDIAHFELAGTQVSTVNSLGQYVAIGSISTDTATYGDRSIVFAGSGEGLPFIQNTFGEQIQFNFHRWDFVDASSRLWLEVNVSGSFPAVNLQVATFSSPAVVWDVPAGSVGTLMSWQVGAVEVAHIDNTGAYTVGASTTYADGTITTTGTLLATNATFQCLSGTALATGETILNAFSGGVTIFSTVTALSNVAMAFDPATTFPGGFWIGTPPNNSASPTGFLFGIAHGPSAPPVISFYVDHTDTVATRYNILDDGRGGMFSKNNTLDNDTGAATFAGLVTMSAGASLTGTLSGVYTVGGTPTLGATLNLNGQTLSGAATFSGAVTFAGTGSVSFSAGGPIALNANPISGGATFSGIITYTNATPLEFFNGFGVDLTITTQTTGAVTLTIPNFNGVSDTLACVTLAQTLANKTLTTPVIASLYAVGAGNLITVPAPAAADTLALLGTAQTFSAVETFSAIPVFSAGYESGGGGGALTSIVVGASPFTYTNAGGFNENVTLDTNGATVASVAINGTTVTGLALAAGGFVVIPLKNGDSITVTYSVATPLMFKYAA